MAEQSMHDEVAKPGSSRTDEHRSAVDVNRNRRRTDAAALLFFTLTVALAGGAFFHAVSDPIGHPFLLALSLAWLVSAFTGALMSKVFFRQDPAHFRLRPWERDGRVYERLGLGTFRWALLHSPFIWLNPSMNMRSGRSDFDRLLRSQRVAEGCHAIAALCTLSLAIWYSLTGLAIVGIWLFIVNVPLNIYPVMLQRWNRGRVQRAQQKLTRLGN